MSNLKRFGSDLKYGPQHLCPLTTFSVSADLFFGPGRTVVAMVAMAEMVFGQSEPDTPAVPILFVSPLHPLVRIHIIRFADFQTLIVRRRVKKDATNLVNSFIGRLHFSVAECLCERCIFLSMSQRRLCRTLGIGLQRCSL